MVFAGDRNVWVWSHKLAIVYRPLSRVQTSLMAKNDWYRNESWDNETEKLFLEKLARARSRRDQYLKIQIGYLAKTLPKHALRLCQLYDDTRTDTSWDLDVKQFAAHAHEALGQIPEAVAKYREILEHQESEPFFPNNVLLETPLLIAGKGQPSDFNFAWNTLERAGEDLSRRGLRFATQTFILHAARALLEHRSGQIEAAKAQARIALDAAAVSHSGLRYHRKAGLVGPEHRPTILELKSITSGLPKWTLRLVARLDSAIFWPKTP